MSSRFLLSSVFLNAPSPLLKYSFGAESDPILSPDARSCFLLAVCPAMLKVEDSVQRRSVCSSVLGPAQDHLPYLELDAEVKNELTNFKLCRSHWGENLAAQPAGLIPELQNVQEHLQLQDSTLNKSLWARPRCLPCHHPTESSMLPDSVRPCHLSTRPWGITFFYFSCS